MDGGTQAPSLTSLPPHTQHPLAYSMKESRYERFQLAPAPLPKERPRIRPPVPLTQDCPRLVPEAAVAAACSKG